LFLYVVKRLSLIQALPAREQSLFGFKKLKCVSEVPRQSK
jgi:hypothetical protein